MLHRQLPVKRFQKVHIEISNICNLQCSFCPEVIRNKKIMDVSVFENIIQQVAPLTQLVCFHLMGDPLVHPHLSELIQICEKHQVKIFFVTNGVLIKDSNADLLLSPAFYQVNFSLHSFFDNFPGKDPTIYLNKIFQWTHLALQQRPDLYINYRLWNLQDVKGSATENIEMLHKIEEQFDWKMNDGVDVRRKKSWRIKNKLYLHFDTEFVWPDIHLPILGSSGTCYGLSSHFGILADGTVVPCCLDKEASIALGNVHEQSVTDILNSARAVAMADGFRQNKLLENLCQRCQYIERFQRKDVL
ncbi:MAG: radical SAM/SPASM domain-containing protein [Pseudobdellovibrionaceae bacterium]|jgi:radical SAM protein with 4Fe4S-binding SPASM domain